MNNSVSKNGNGVLTPIVQFPKRKESSQKLKVAYIVSRFPKITETFVLYEMLAVEQQAVEIDLYPLQREKTDVIHPEAHDFVARANFKPLLSWPIIKSHLHFLTRKPGAYLKTLWAVLKANLGSRRYLMGAIVFFPKIVHFAYMMQARGVQHVHAHFASHPAMAAFVINGLLDIPYSFTGHGSDLNRDRHMLCEKVEKADFVVPISNFFKEMIVDHCGEQYRSKVAVVHCGVDTQVFHPKSNHVLVDNKLAIFCVGTLHEVKGQTYLIEACRLLKARGVDFSCHFLGDGPDWKALEQQAVAAGIDGQVTFHGRLKHQEIADLLQTADVLVTPSVPTSDGRREGIPVVLMEAMASGLPVIASDISGIPELVKHEKSGLLTPPGDSEAIADGLEHLYHHPELRQQYSVQGRDMVVNEFDLYHNAATLAAYFQRGK